MKKSSEPAVTSKNLDEMIEGYLRSLFEKLDRPHTLDEIAQDLTLLSGLLYSFRREDRMVGRLLDESASKEECAQIIKMLRACSIRVASDRGELEEFYKRIHSLLERASLMVARAQTQVGKETIAYCKQALESRAAKGRADKSNANEESGRGERHASARA